MPTCANPIVPSLLYRNYPRYRAAVLAENVPLTPVARRLDAAFPNSNFKLEFAEIIS